MAFLELLESQKLISHKIWVIEKSWNFHTVCGSPALISHNYVRKWWEKFLEFPVWYEINDLTDKNLLQRIPQGTSDHKSCWIRSSHIYVGLGPAQNWFSSNFLSFWYQTRIQSLICNKNSKPENWQTFCIFWGLKFLKKYNL